MGLLDQMQPTPRNRIMGLLADALTAANDYANKPDKAMPGGMANPPLSMLSGLLGMPSLATTAQRASYGEPLTNAGKANVPFLKPETADALMMAPLSPRTALGALGLAGGIADTGALRAATVWHGSPHKFDKFDASKIGTGEGAQAYGHGLYLAEHPAVAQEYADKLSSAGLARNTLSQNGGAIAAAINSAEKSVSGYRELIAQGGGGDPRRAQSMLSIAEKKLADLRSIKAGTLDESGNMYKVDLPDQHIAKMLDYDKPLSQQSPSITNLVKDRIQNAGQFPDGGWFSRNGPQAIPIGHGATLDEAVSNMTGQRAYDFIKPQATTAGEREAANILRQAGIPGIKYLDGGSRTVGQGSSNYVVFPGNEGLLSILERNGAPVGK